MKSFEEILKSERLQFHPPKSEYVNLHPFCLHMWKQVGVDNQTPEAWMI